MREATRLAWLSSVRENAMENITLIDEAKTKHSNTKKLHDSHKLLQRAWKAILKGMPFYD